MKKEHSSRNSVNDKSNKKVLLLSIVNCKTLKKAIFFDTVAVTKLNHKDRSTKTNIYVRTSGAYIFLYFSNLF